MERPSPSQIVGPGVGMVHHPGASPHSSSASLSSFLGGGPNQGGVGGIPNQGSGASPGSVSAGIMSMSLVGPGPNMVAHGSPTSPSQHLHGSSPGSSNTSMAIRHEIQRFESVHPSIYAIYDLIEHIPDPLLAQQIREHVVCIEDSFVNSQEWTLSRGVPDIRLGIVGSLSSGKSALVHRYLTGSYMQEESPEGGRFKKEVVVDGHSYLLLIRDEGGPPELQFTSWVDAVIFVFSLENEASFNAIYNYYVKMSQFRNMQEIPLILVGTQDAISENQPRVIDDSRARKLASDLKRCSYYETCATYGLNVERVFQDACQKLTHNRPINSRPTTPNHYTPRTPYPATPGNYSVTATSPSTNNGYPGGAPPSPGFHTPASQYDRNTSYKENRPPMHMMTPGTNNSYHYPMYHDDGSFAVSAKTATGRGIMVPPPMPPPSTSIPPSHRIGSNNTGTLSSTGSAGSTNEISTSNSMAKFAIPHNTNEMQTATGGKDNASGSKELPTPSSTPTSSRKNRRRSNLFTPSKKNQNSDGDSKDQNGVHGSSGGAGSAAMQGPQLGSGRSIPIRQGLLYKKSNKSFSKDWKKKYVTLCDDGRMTYYPSLNDYMSNVHGKDIPLQYVTVKVPGQKPRGSRTVQTQQSNPQSHVSESNFGSTNSTSVSTSSSTSNIMSGGVTSGTKGEKVLLTSYEMLSGDNVVENNNDIEKINVNNAQEKTTPNVKKRHHRRIKSNGVKSSASSFLQSSGNHENVNGGSADDSGGSCGGIASNAGGGNSDCNNFEFHIVSLDNKQWYFEASSCEERDEWVSAIEQQILNTLQGNESSKAKGGHSASSIDIQKMKTIKSEVPGNNKCVDCDSPNPDWASINLGVLICIECSGVHRNLGSHISRVRSLDLDEWPPGHLAVMTAIGNRTANSIWEHRISRHGVKPSPNSSQEEKERFIIAKYSRREFLMPLPNQPGNMNNASHLVDAICRSDIKTVALVLAHCSSDDVNSSVSPRDARSPLHLASSLGNLAFVQLLIWSNANVKAIDHEGRTCISHARTSGVSELVELLLSNGCPDITLSGTLPRRKNSLSSHRKNEILEKVTSSVL